MNFRLDYRNVLPFVSEREILSLKDKILKADKQLSTGKGAGAEFTGWLHLPSKIGKKELAEIKKLASEIRKNAETLAVVGIGGSYLGARAAISALSKDSKLGIVYSGKNISGQEMEHQLACLEKRDFYLNVISKSGTTTEPAIAFRMLKKLAQKKYGKKYGQHIIATTDAQKGALRKLSDQEGFRTFVIPDNIGGRFSVLTPVGLIPIACAGIDIEALVAGAKAAEEFCAKKGLKDNPAFLYAAIRFLLYKKGKKVEMMSSFDPRLRYLTEWWKQLFGESEGKGCRGIFPASCTFTTDLHSLGQYIQDGERQLFETFLVVEKTSKLKVQSEKGDLDGLNYLAGRTIDEINLKAYEGTRQAHTDGKVPNLSLIMPELNPKTLGELLYFFEISVAISGYLLGVNPFDQPGVEAYKKNMFRLLGKG
ncbi:MAG: glucose-6-phosphate isomerase [Candidatus Wallbacteria bacterium]|nr:glucose-6-phosphate isomerase [Candidatus Wallbacteria bacterium]